MVMHGVACLNRGRRDTSGKTPYELRYGRRWNGKMAEFGERVMWLPEGKRASRLDSGYRAGIFLGLVEGAAAYYVGVHEKIVPPPCAAYPQTSNAPARSSRLETS